MKKSLRALGYHARTRWASDRSMCLPSYQIQHNTTKSLHRTCHLSDLLSGLSSTRANHAAKLPSLCKSLWKTKRYSDSPIFKHTKRLAPSVPRNRTTPGSCGTRLRLGPDERLRALASVGDERRSEKRGKDRNEHQRGPGT